MLTYMHRALHDGGDALQSPSGVRRCGCSGSARSLAPDREASATSRARNGARQVP